MSAQTPVAWFCDTADCVFHRPNPDGHNWATANGITVDRAVVRGKMQCLICRQRENSRHAKTDPDTKG